LTRRSSCSFARPGKITAEDRRYWAFQPINATGVPAGDDANPIDRFVRARLQKEGIKAAPDADPRTLLRRCYFDIIGLPPTAEEVEDLLPRGRARALSRKRRLRESFDRLLASPHYGERVGRHWLDLVRYAESDGYRLDSFRPHIWRYRDYVIKSFNTTSHMTSSSANRSPAMSSIRQPRCSGRHRLPDPRHLRVQPSGTCAISGTR